MRNKIFILFLAISVIPFWAYGQSGSINSKRLYLIIVSDDYVNSSSLLEFKKFREKDFNVQIVTGTSIGTSKDDYRNYIRGLMPGYVLLVEKFVKI